MRRSKRRSGPETDRAAGGRFAINRVDSERRRSPRAGRRYTDAPAPQGRSPHPCQVSTVTTRVVQVGSRIGTIRGVPFWHKIEASRDQLLDRGVPHDYRRERPRVDGLVLTHSERESLLEAEERVRRCSTVWAEARRVGPVAGVMTEERLLIKLGCGHRTCKTCQRRALQMRSNRLLGDWTTMLTLTYGRALRTVGDAWRRVTDDAQWLCRTLSRAHKRHTDTPCEYAWVLEEHKDGWPHIHIVGSWSCDLMDDHTLRMLWTSRAGADSWVVDWRPTDDPAAVRSYLSKYLSKGALRPDVAAALGKRRMFGRSRDLRPVIEEPDRKDWQELRIVDQMEAAQIMDGAFSWKGHQWDWMTNMWSEGRVMRRSRRLPACAAIENGLTRWSAQMEEARAEIPGVIDANRQALAWIALVADRRLRKWVDRASTRSDSQPANAEWLLAAARLERAWKDFLRPRCTCSEDSCHSCREQWSLDILVGVADSGAANTF